MNKYNIYDEILSQKSTKVNTGGLNIRPQAALFFLCVFDAPYGDGAVVFILRKGFLPVVEGRLVRVKIKVNDISSPVGSGDLVLPFVGFGDHVAEEGGSDGYGYFITPEIIGGLGSQCVVYVHTGKLLFASGQGEYCGNYYYREGKVYEYLFHFFSFFDD